MFPDCVTGTAKRSIIKSCSTDAEVVSFTLLIKLSRYTNYGF